MRRRWLGDAPGGCGSDGAAGGVAGLGVPPGEAGAPLAPGARSSGGRGGLGAAPPPAAEIPAAVEPDVAGVAGADAGGFPGEADATGVAAAGAAGRPASGRGLAAASAAGAVGAGTLVWARGWAWVTSGIICTERFNRRSSPGCSAPTPIT